MNTRYLTLRALFQHLVLVGAVPMAGCGSTVVMTGGDASTPDRSDPVDTSVTDVRVSTDVPTVDTGVSDVATDAVITTDVVTPGDSSTCAPQVGPDVTCSYSVMYPCGDPPRDSAGSLICAEICSRDAGFTAGCYMGPPDGGPTVVVQCTYCAVGRRVDGFAPTMGADGGAVGRFYAAVSQLEAVSVVAFERLAAELTAAGAPISLRDEALRAADDERRHTRDTRRLARNRGATVQAPPRLSKAPRPTLAMALDNAVEGCVRETFGALVSTWQASHAADAEVARVMEGIAVDETRHAALSWEVAAWLDGVLDNDARAQVAAARRCAAEELLRELASPVDAALVRDAGMPPPEVAQRLAREMLTAMAA